MESLRFDVAPYGISTTIVEPGFFRTELLVEGASSIWPELSIEDYAERTTQTIDRWKSMNGKQGGDPAKLSRALVQLVALDETPLRWPASNQRHAISSPRLTRTANCRPHSITTTPKSDAPDSIHLTPFQTSSDHPARTLTLTPTGSPNNVDAHSTAARRTAAGGAHRSAPGPGPRRRTGCPAARQQLVAPPTDRTSPRVRRRRTPTELLAARLSSAPQPAYGADRRPAVVDRAARLLG